MSRVWTITLNPAIDLTVRLVTLEPGAVHRAEGEQVEAGGKGVGVASVLAALGVPVAASGWLGADNAALFEATFARRGIDDAMLRIAGVTRTNIKLAVASRGDSTDINLPGIALSPDALAQAETGLLQRLESQVQPGDWCVLAGSLPPGAGIGTLERLARRLTACGAELLIDTGGSALRELLARLGAGKPAALPALIKPNRAELEELVGRPLASATEVAEAAEAICRQGVRHVVVSLGSDGAVIASGAGRWQAAPPKVRVATTVGAGDALVGGTVAELIGGSAMPKAAVFGMACAAARIQRIAAELPARAEIDRLAQQIRVERV